MEDVSHLIARFLKERMVDRVFSLCGGHILPIWDHIHRLGIRIIDVRDERAAVHMAHAHRELTGRLGVALVTAGPGMTNAVTGIANAHVSRIPILVISGVPPRPQENMGALQSVPQAEIVRPITRYARTILRAEHVLRELDEAVSCAEGHCGEPGPAFIDFPTDLLREEIPETLVDTSRFRVREFAAVIPSQENIQATVDMLWKATRPLVISGRGTRGAEKGLLQILDALGCVYLDTAEGRGLVPEDHPAYMPAMRGRAMREADVVLTIGRTLDFQLGYGSRAVFPNAGFVRIGRSASELRGNRRADVELFGSSQEVLESLVKTSKGESPATDRAWVEEMRAIDIKRRQGLRQKLLETPPGKDGAMHPYQLLGYVQEALKEDAIVVADGGDFLSFSRIALTGSAYLDCGAFGCLGVGVPFGIASALAFPKRQVVVLSGDGSFGFNAIELDTCRRHEARVVFIVANNGGWNIERNDQKEAYGGRIVGTELEECDYAGLARSLGVHGERVERPEDLPDVIRRAFDQAPAVLDVTVTRDAVSPDAAAGIPGIPNKQALSTWDELEQSG
ncbi:MAG: thiamine pyrophosphate-binding protein [Desulfobacteraceae bacterium]|uniref:Thiamine pyrophosphate-binding protein n=1 Tax=Candidatus Desulfacyla euxinica TaxID=2841693 RepID=A0A8J6N047_9DELT|nr:thiamine pyrophosphate-binding protein [Candidatus Desulfacyla euxinica]MBL6977477.1 thiamine pyrophosphate-binding protein [Desulfobacteraceae bacterium]MBL7216223.1 thiamine pyrophosphate-binding protein [Desulfobacteraceae bacterium]